MPNLPLICAIGCAAGWVYSRGMNVRLTMRDSFLVLLKEARSEGDLARLRRERDVLARLRMAGVTRILSDELGDDGRDDAFSGSSQRSGEESAAEARSPALAFRFAGRHTLAEFRTAREWEILQIFQECAQVLTKLHARGIAHCAISPDHILLDRFSRPVLCSFGRAAELDASMSLAKADVSSLLATMQSVVSAMPGNDPAWAKRLRGERKRLSQQLLHLLQAAAESRVASAADIAAQLGELAANYGLLPSQLAHTREPTPAEPATTS